MMYNYYCFETDSAWDICAVRTFLEEHRLSSADGYSFDNKAPFISLSLLYLKGEGGWNTERDRDEELCNYIPVVTSDLSDSDPYVQELFSCLSEFLGAELKEDW
ncbi:hypothetical protein [uncultured Ruminococcus sp.]|uniref:hypothetical protein n=1 Tax=uncultured Ruminococcus sp. TaxID=165186 RepID=UPI0025E19E3C|nr:hypothetical protein [uncultured Ruminococcus sp.]